MIESRSRGVLIPRMRGGRRLSRGALRPHITARSYAALSSQSSKRVGMIRAPSSGTSVRNASGAP